MILSEKMTPPSREYESRIDTKDVSLGADVAVPQRRPSGVVVFAHGSGSSRQSPRNVSVARTLQAAGFATVLLDLLTPEEAARDQRTAEHRFDIPLLTARVVAACDWVRRQQELATLPLGLFGASTGAAAALDAAALRPGDVSAVVSRGGRPDLAGMALQDVGAAVLLIVGSKDPDVLELNRAAVGRLSRCESSLLVVPGAGHLFEEPGTLREVARAASEAP